MTTRSRETTVPQPNETAFICGLVALHWDPMKPNENAYYWLLGASLASLGNRSESWPQLTIEPDLCVGGVAYTRARAG